MSDQLPGNPEEVPPSVDEDLAFALAAFGEDLRDLLDEEEPAERSNPQVAVHVPADAFALDSLQERYGDRLHDGSKLAYANAIALACSQAADSHATQAGRYVMFSLGDQNLGIPLTAIREVTDVSAITPLPRTPAWLQGVCQLRGQLFSVTDLTSLLHIETGQATGRLIVVHSEANRATTAIMVDSIVGLRAPPEIAQEIRDCPKHLGPFLSGKASIDGQIFYLLDPDRLLGCPQLSCYLGSTASIKR